MRWSVVRAHPPQPKNLCSGVGSCGAYRFVWIGIISAATNHWRHAERLERAGKKDDTSVGGNELIEKPKCHITADTRINSYFPHRLESRLAYTKF